MRVLTLRELNRATLARQLLLERRRMSPLAAIEALVGMQAQWAPAPYIGLWSRVEGFRREQLEKAILGGKVLRPTVMRGTLHLVTTRDYPTFYAALRNMPTWFGPTHLAHAQEELAAVRALGTITHEEGLAHLERAGHTDGTERRRIFHAVRRHAHLLHVPETALWSGRPPRVLFAAVDEPDAFDELEARREIVHRYLRAFGPSTKADVADWSGLRVRDFEHALDGLRTYLTEDGRTLFDVPRAPLPHADTPAPVRFLPKWDNVLLAHADRSRILPHGMRKLVIGKNGDVAQTVLVDGFVAATWWVEKKRVVVESLGGRLPREVTDEASRLEDWLG
jgi:uncharacterized protein YcaQ